MFRVGQKVVCVDDKARTIYNCTVTKNKIYTVLDLVTY